MKYQKDTPPTPQIQCRARGGYDGDEVVRGGARVSTIALCHKPAKRGPFINDTLFFLRNYL